jgi:hypothetical protein
MPHQDNIAIVVVQFGESVVEPSLQFLMDRGRCRGFFAVHELRDELNARLIRPGRALNRLLAVDASPLCFAMPAMGVDDPILGQVPKPKVKRHGRILQIFRQPLIRFEQNVLDNVAGIDPPSQHWIEPKVDDLSERFAKFAKQAIDGRRLAVFGVAKQSFGFIVVRPHGGSIVVVARCDCAGLAVVLNSKHLAENSMESEKVLCRTPTPNKKPKYISKTKFEPVHRAIIRVTPKRGQGILFTDLFDLVAEKLTPRELQDLGNVSWYVTTVKLELEVRGELERVPKVVPQRLRRTR